MKRFLGVLILMLMTSQAFGAYEWREGDGTNTITGNTVASDIDSASFQNIVDPLDRLTSNYNTTRLSYASASTITVVAGEVTCSSSDGSVRRMRANPSDLTLAWSDIDTGTEDTETTYYVWLVADADAETYTGVISESSTEPNGVTYYKRIGSFYNDASGNISQINNDKEYGEFGIYESKSSGVTYQALTDGFVIANLAPNTTISSLKGYTDSSSSPTTLICDIGSGPDQTKINFSMQVSSGDYWKVNVTGGSATLKKGETMKYVFLIMIMLSNLAFADVYVLSDKETGEIYSLSSQDDAVCPVTKEKGIIKGKLKDLDLTYDSSYYTFKSVKIKLNVKKLEDQAKVEAEARKKAERKAKIKAKAEAMAEQALIDSGELEPEVE
jgi:hypothetical protein